MWAAIIQAAIQIGAATIGGLLGEKEDKKAYEYRMNALAEMMGISVPELEELAAQEQKDTNLKDVSTDPRFDAFQDEAQERLTEIGRSGGMDIRSRSRMEQGRMEQARAEQASREGVLADARARGTLGTGEELSALLQAGQASADRARMADVATLADAEERALEAIISGGAMAGERQARQWSQRAQVATAQDEIDRFNTSTANNFMLANADLRQQHFQNQMTRGQARNDARYRMAEHHEGRGAQFRQMIGGIGQGAGQGAAAVGQYAGQGKAGAGQGATQSMGMSRYATDYEAQNPAAIGSNAALQPALATRRKAR